MRKHFFCISLVLALLITLQLTGCRLFRRFVVNNTQQTAFQVTTDRASSVSFSLIYPDSIKASSRSNSIEGIGKNSPDKLPKVVFRLILINMGNETEPTTTITKVVTADANGMAAATFPDVMANTAIGEVKIEDGSINSYTYFHGAADLVAKKDNVILLVPKESKMAEDVVAAVIKIIAADPLIFPKAELGLAGKIFLAMAGLNLNAPTVYQDTLAAFLNLLEKAPVIEVETPVFVDSGSAGSAGGANQYTFYWQRN